MFGVSLGKMAMALGFGLILALVVGFVLTRVAEKRGCKRLFTTFFVVLVCSYALGFAARYVIIEILP